MYRLVTRFNICILSLCCILLHANEVFTSEQNIGQLPHCTNKDGFILVSTLDGRLTSLSSSGSVLWSLETGPGPLLTSNINHVELSNNGEWIRMIPSLSGKLYKFNGKTIDAVPITADSLLKSSFLYSNDLIIAGGKEVRTYGVLSKTGQHIYTCLLDGCHNETDGRVGAAAAAEDEIVVVDDDVVVVIERSTSVVRAHEPRTGVERWNFSVGHHNINIPLTSCSVNAVDMSIAKLKLTAILPDGILFAHDIGVKLWEHKLVSPIVQVWTWNGRDLKAVDLLKRAADTESDMGAVMYLGMHRKQLYIHEASSFTAVGRIRTGQQQQTPRPIPWKPVLAGSAVAPSGGSDEQLHGTTALSVLYGSEYVNGNGFYLYSAEATPPNTCSHNGSELLAAANQGLYQLLQFYWQVKQAYS